MFTADLSPLTPAFDPRSVHVRFVVDKMAPGQVFLPVLRISCQYRCSNAPHSSSSTRCSNLDKRAKPGYLRKNNVLPKIAYMA